MFRANGTVHRIASWALAALVCVGLIASSAVAPAQGDAGGDDDVHETDTGEPDVQPADVAERADARSGNTSDEPTAPATDPFDSDPQQSGSRGHSGSPLPKDARSLDPPSTGSELGSMLLETLLVLAAVCLLAYVVLRWGVSRLVGARGAGEGPIEILARQPLGTDTSILVVRIGPKTLIVADGESGMTRLGELDEEEAEAIAASKSDEEAPDSRVPTWLPTWLRPDGETP